MSSTGSSRCRSLTSVFFSISKSPKRNQIPARRSLINATSGLTSVLTRLANSPYLLAVLRAGCGPLNSSACVKSSGPHTCSVAPVSTRSTTKLVHQQPRGVGICDKCAEPSRGSSIRVANVACEVAVELKQGGGTGTRFLLLLALLLSGGSTSPPQRQCSCSDNLTASGCSLAYLSAIPCPFLPLPFFPLDMFALLAFVTIHGVNFQWRFSH